VATAAAARDVDIRRCRHNRHRQPAGTAPAGPGYQSDIVILSSLCPAYSKNPGHDKCLYCLVFPVLSALTTFSTILNIAHAMMRDEPTRGFFFDPCCCIYFLIFFRDRKDKQDSGKRANVFSCPVF
jgi:hypothetical protein